MWGGKKERRQARERCCSFPLLLCSAPCGRDRKETSHGCSGPLSGALNSPTNSIVGGPVTGRAPRGRVEVGRGKETLALLWGWCLGASQPAPEAGAEPCKPQHPRGHCRALGAGEPLWMRGARSGGGIRGGTVWGGTTPSSEICWASGAGESSGQPGAALPAAALQGPGSRSVAKKTP